MSIRLKLLLSFSIVVLLAAGVAGYGYQLISSTSALVAGLQDGPMMAANSARSAQLGFGKARRIVEKSVLLHKPASEEELAQIDDFMTMLSGNISEVKKRLANAAGFNDGIDSIMPMADDWHKAAMAFLKPAGADAAKQPSPQAGRRRRQYAERPARHGRRKLQHVRRQFPGGGRRRSREIEAEPDHPRYGRGAGRPGRGVLDRAILQPADPSRHGGVGGDRQRQFLEPDRDQAPRRTRPAAEVARPDPRHPRRSGAQQGA